MKTQYYTATSLDGFIADPQNSIEWLMQLGDPEGGGAIGFHSRRRRYRDGLDDVQWLLNNYIHPGSEMHNHGRIRCRRGSS
jgi:hypothetical protein